MKNISPIISFFIFPVYFLFTSIHYNAFSHTTDDVDAWISQSLITTNNELLVGAHDIQMMLNMFYLSYERSRITLQAQEKAMIILNAVWNGWQNIAQRRRNPSKKIPFPDSADELINSHHSFAQLLKRHEIISSLYEQWLDTIVKQDGLENKLLKKSFEYVREGARTQVTYALLNVQEHIATLNSYLKQHRHMRFDDEQMLDDLETTRAKIFGYIQEQLPILAFNSYVESDKLFISCSQKQWKALLTTQELSNLVWHCVETSRANYYRAYYTRLYEKMIGAGIAPQTLYSQQDTLPTPDELE